MSRIIDADALRSLFEEMANDPYAKTMQPQSWSMAYESVCVDVDRMPTLDYAPVRHGEWIEKQFEYPDGEVFVMRTCSLCGRETTEDAPYCHCGAKMDGGKR